MTRSRLASCRLALAVGLAGLGAVAVAVQDATAQASDQAPGPAATPGGAGPAPGTPAIACDDLVALRRLSVAADPAEARAHLSDHPGCRTLDRGALGAVERRAMIGGAPFECLTPAAGGVCLWVLP